jgi:DNA-binding response OmpR family regulator
VRILYLEDDADIAEAVVERLALEHYDVVHVTTPDAALATMWEAPFDLAVLDVMIGRDAEAGFGVAAALRDAEFGGGILFLSARGAVSDRIRGLDLGGDDYLVKPFSLDELVARVRALLRRDLGLKRAVARHGGLEVDLAGREVRWHGTSVDLSDREFSLLELLVHEPDRIFPAEELADRVFPSATSGPAIVRVYVGHLRRKLHDDVVVTRQGGYRLGPP